MNTQHSTLNSQPRSLLAIESSTSTGSVALLDEHGTVLLERTFRAERRHPAALFGVLEEILAGHPPPKIIAVGLGPGSYAGVRVAIAAALGLRIATGAELRGVPSIAALPTPASEYHVVGDARRHSFYLAHIGPGGLAETPALFPMNELASQTAGLAPLYVAEPFVAAGHLAHLPPSAARVGQLARAGDFTGPRNALEPLYLRDPHITAAKPAQLSTLNSQPSPTPLRP